MLCRTQGSVKVDHLNPGRTSDMTDLFQRDLYSISSNPSSRHVSDVVEDEEDEKDEEEELLDRDNPRR